MNNEKIYDVITYGRSSLDLYSQAVGARFEDIPGFHAFVGRTRAACDPMTRAYAAA